MSQQSSLDHKLLGQRIRHERSGCGLTQAELAERVSVSTGTITRLEAGDANIAIGLIGQVAAALNVSVVHLLENQESPQKVPAKLGPEVFSKNLSRICELKGITRDALMILTNIERGTLSTYFNGTRVPGPKNLKLICEALQVKAQDLWINPLKHGEPISEQDDLSTAIMSVLQNYQKKQRKKSSR